MKQWLRLRLESPGIRRQLWGLFGLLLVAGAAVLVLDEIEQARARDTLLTLQDDTLQRMRRLKAVSDAYGLDVVDTAFRARNNLITWNEGATVVAGARGEIAAQWDALAAMPRNARQQRLFDEVTGARARADRATAVLEDILLAQDAAALAEFADTELYAAVDPVTERLQELSDLAMLEAERVVREDLDRQQRVSMLRMGLSLAVLLLVAWLGQRVLRNVYNGIENLHWMARRMRERDFEAQPRYRARGELGEVQESFERMRAEVAAAETELTGQLERNEAVRAELARRELFLRSLLDAAQVAIMAVDHEGRWSVFNPAAERLLGWRADEVIGRRVRYGEATPGDAPLLVTPRQAEDTAAWLREKLGRHVPDDWRALYALADLRQPPAESRMLHRDGREVPVLLALSAFDDAAGQRAGMIAVAADLTRIKRLEDELRDSEARAHAANQAKSAFLATMSHEIRTPMIGVTGMLEVLAHSRLDGDQRHALNVIQQSAQSLLQVVGDILDFSKIEAGRLDLVAVPTDLPRLVRGTVANFSGAASSKGLKLSATVDPRVAAAHLADPMRLRQVLANGLSNAIKFTSAGSVELALEHESRAEDESCDRLCFRITDTGI
ncbi:MAG TPA: histidine kinase dimerization/phospho-acceptor domain-containing protein, partial [Xanthomonadaceae bacterium]|nr:histidine kinase dimerization/phospho-acceptor domain-containing protein [Xanthomonadaceae bacterium]